MAIRRGDALLDYELPPQRFSLDAWHRNIERILRMEATLQKRAQDRLSLGRLVARAFDDQQAASFGKELELRKARHEQWRDRAARALENSKDHPKHERMSHRLEVRYG